MATTRDWQEGLMRSSQCSWVRRSVRSSYITRSQRLCGLRPQSPSRAVVRCFAHCARPVSCEGETRLLTGELYLTLQSATTVQTTVVPVKRAAYSGLRRPHAGFLE